MDNFIFHNPTRLIFGKGMIAQLSQQIPADKRIMITFGGGSVKTNGVYEQVIQALEGRDYTEFWGIESNPDISTLKKAIESGKEKNIDFLLGSRWRLSYRRHQVDFRWYSLRRRCLGTG